MFYRKDILGELVKVYNDEGIDVYFYFLVMDWSYLDYCYEIILKEDSIVFSCFLIFIDYQLKELVICYLIVKDFWFDGIWDVSIKKNGWWIVYVE